MNKPRVQGFFACKASDTDPGCSLGIGDQRIPRLIRRILQLNLDGMELSYIFLLFAPSLSPVTSHYSPATTFLNESPADHALQVNEKPGVGIIKLGVPA